MKKPFTILLPIDYKSETESSIKYAFNLAKSLPAELFFLHVYGISNNDPSNPLEYAVDLSKIYNLEYEKLQRFVIEMLDIHGYEDSDFHIRIDVAEGTVNNQVKRMAEIEHVDLILLSSHEPREIKEYIFGTHTKAIANESQIPVLSIPENATYKPWQNILYASNLQLMETKSLKEVIKIAERNNATLHILHIETDDEDKWETMAEFDTFRSELVNSIDYKNVVIDIQYDQSNVAESLMDYAKAKNIDLIATHPYRPNLTELVFGRHVTKELIYHSEVPILSITK